MYRLEKGVKADGQTAWGPAGVAGGDAVLVLQINVQRFQSGLVFKAHRLCVSLNAGLKSHKEEEGDARRGCGRRRKSKV